MSRGLRFVFALWVAVALIVAPIGASRAEPCHEGRIAAAAMPDVHRHHTDGASDPGRADPGRMSGHCGSGHLCCSAACFGTAIPAAPHEPIAVETGRTTPRPIEDVLPDGIAAAPPIGPPRAAV